MQLGVSCTAPAMAMMVFIMRYRTGGLWVVLVNCCARSGKEPFQCVGIQARGSHGLIGYLPIGTIDGVHALGVHVGLNAVLNGLHFCGQLVRHAAKPAQLLDLAVHFR